MIKKTGLEKLRAAFERLKSGKTIIVPSGAKVNPKNVQLEADMGDGAVYYYPDLLEEIKVEKQRLSDLSKSSENKKTSKISDNKTKQLKESNIKLKQERDASLVAQTELAYNLFQSCDDPKFIVDAYNP